MKLYSTHDKNYRTYWSLLFGLLNRQVIVVQGEPVGQRWRIGFIPIHVKFKYYGE
jgi:hypothetical protein